MVVAKWLPIFTISCFATILGLAAFGYSYPASYPKRATPKRESVNTRSSEMISSKSESRSWEQPTGGPKRGLDDDDDVNHPTEGVEQMPHAAEFLERVDKMRFFKGRQTSHKRSWPIPQLQCKDGCETYEPSMVQCTNVKSPDQDVAKWRCEADLPRHLKFQKTKINCEGFESVDDNRILRGSCGLEYSLTHSGLKQVPGRVHRHYYTIANEDEDESMGGWTASWLVVIAVCLYLLWSSVKTPVTEPEGLRAKVATAHQAWAQTAQSN